MRTARTVRNSKCTGDIYNCWASLLRVVFVSVLLRSSGLCRHVFIVGFSELTAKVVERVGSRLKVRWYSRRIMLHRRKLGAYPAFPDFVSGSKTGEGTHFLCLVCKRDVVMKAHGSREFARHPYYDSLWFYRAHMGMPVLNRLMERTELSEEQLAEYRAKPLVELGTDIFFLSSYFRNTPVWSRRCPSLPSWAVCVTCCFAEETLL